MRFLILPTSGWARNTARTTLRHHSWRWLRSSHTPGRDHPPKHPPGYGSAGEGCSSRGSIAERRPAQTAAGSSFKTHAPRRKIFLVKKSNDSFVDPKNYFGTERAPPRRSPMPVLAAHGLLGILKLPRVGGCRRDIAPPSLPDPPGLRTPETAGGQGCCAIPLYTFQFGPYPFRPPAGFVIQRKLVRSLDKQTGNRVFHCAYALSAGG